MEAKCTVKYAFNKMTDEFLHGVAKTLLDFLLTRRVALLFNAFFCSNIFQSFFAILDNKFTIARPVHQNFPYTKENK